MKLRLVLLFLLLVAGGGFRLAVVSNWHQAGGDGIHYFQLSQEILHDHRFALGPPPVALTYARMPGYPLFLAYCAVRRVPVGLEQHLIRATRANVALDLITALLVLAVLLDSGAGWAVALTGLGITLVCPLLLQLCCYGLSESLATALGALAIGLALRAMRGRIYLYAAFTGVVAGLGLLTRVDTVTLAAPIGVALFCAGGPLTRRLKAIALGAVVALALFAPWPIRNLRKFGALHAQGTYWRTQEGRPLSTAMIEWERTWATSAPGESYLDLAGAAEYELDPERPNILLSQMYDDEAERQRIAALFHRLNSESWSLEVIHEFRQLARERRARHPFKVYVTLPLQRIYHLFAPIPEWELPMKVDWLGLPDGRWLFGWLHGFIYLFAAIGMVALWRRGGISRKLLLVLSAWLAARTLLFGYAVPVGTTQRYLIEAFPAVLTLCAIGLGAAVQWPRQKRTRPTSA